MNNMNFKKKTWYNKEDNTGQRIPISAQNLNRIEDGIQEAFDEIAYTNLKNLVIQKITSSCEWVAPKAVKNLFRVFAVGGGGGGGDGFFSTNSVKAGGGGGGGGYIDILDIELKKDTQLTITCGAGGKKGEDGGKTVFGDYLSVQGGKAGESALSETSPGSGGSGGSGGGGGGIFYDIRSGSLELVCSNGGNGSAYGGGGGAGNGDGDGIGALTYGFGGISSVDGDLSRCGYGGTRGVIPEIGKVMTEGIINCLFDSKHIQGIRTPLTGEGSGGIGCNGGKGVCSGGGGFCGKGGDSSVVDSAVGSGGGGGYCGSGGNGGGYCGSGGGGGGFFCDGGTPGDYESNGGGGGGFFCDGTSTGKGGDGGVLIMYIKDDSLDEEDNA